MSDELEVRARLARLPHPQMPAPVASAIRAALAAQPAAEPVVALTSRHRRRLNWLLAAAGVAAFGALVPLTTTAAPAPVAEPPVVRAGAVFEPTRLSEQLRERMQQAPTTAPTATFADSPAGISACAKAVQAYGPVMSLDAGTYADTDAVVVVTKYVGAADYEEVWVVSPTCGSEQTLVMRHFLVDVDRTVGG